MDLLSSISDIKGVGDKTSKVFNNLGVYTIQDILLFFPRTYLVYNQPICPNPDYVKQLVCIPGRVKTFPKTVKTRTVMVTSVLVQCKNESVEMVWFNAPYIKNMLEAGKQYYFYGRLLKDGNRYKISQPEIYDQDKYLSLMDSIQPIYHTAKGLSNNLIKKAVSYAFENCNGINSFVPEEFVSKNNLLDYFDAVKTYHFPENYEKLAEARRRLAYDELFYFILNARLQEDNNVSYPNNFNIIHHSQVTDIINSLPYKLTNGQLTTYNEIIEDLSSAYISQRLVQGDVGSGKTIVAFLTMLEVCLSGYQAALMAPTEVLARQHYESFLSLVNEFGLDIPVVLFTGSQKKSERTVMQSIVDSHDACFIIGTHALISEGRNFHNLAYVITDEQHRFGVKQREALSKKGNTPHMLVMSATPIPRTLAMILYGNMHISAIKELPANRLPIKTCVIKEGKRAVANKFIQDEILKGHQVYIICPLVEASETTEAQNVLDYSKDLNAYFNGKYSIDVLHGKMKNSEKLEVMERFSSGQTNILVSTTVVEVGVNVPNATVIMIENANRFGLAALHQLRGRVGRGNAQSYCILMNTSNDKNGDKRLEVLLKSNDGFYIASEDLKLRGPGDFFGIRQSGEFSFKIADIYNDSDVLKIASDDVEYLLKEDPKLENHKELSRGLASFLADQSYVL